MIIGVISDTHGNMKLAHAAADRIRGVEKADLLLHLGDNYPDAEELGVAGHPIRMVPGLWCAQYRDHRVPKTIVDTVDDLSFAMLHADQDLGPRERSAALIMSGHTHVAKIEPSGNHVYMNPGHLKSMMDRGQRPSYAIIETNPDEIRISIKELDGTTRLQRTFARAALAQP